MTLFDECKEALKSDFYILSLQEQKIILDEFYMYPFEYGNVEKNHSKITQVDFLDLINLINRKTKSSEVYVICDMQGIPIFRTNLLLALEKIDDISALSTKVFFLGDGYLAQVVSRKVPIDIFEIKKEKFMNKGK